MNACKWEMLLDTDGNCIAICLGNAISALRRDMTCLVPHPMHEEWVTVNPWCFPQSFPIVVRLSDLPWDKAYRVPTDGNKIAI